jgi:hypothetical protein
MATLPMGDSAAKMVPAPDNPYPKAVADSIARMPAAGKPLFTAPIEEQPASTLVDAVSLVARAVTAKIAYHQAQIDALRRALRPFNEMSKHSDLPPGSAGADDAVEQLLAIARNLDKGSG